MCSKLLNHHSLRLHLRMKKVAKTGETETLPQSHTTAGEMKLFQLLWCAQEFLPRRYSFKDRGGNRGKLSNCLKNVSYPSFRLYFTLSLLSTTTQDAERSHSDPDWSSLFSSLQTVGKVSLKHKNNRYSCLCLCVHSVAYSNKKKRIASLWQNWFDPNFRWLPHLFLVHIFFR